MVKEEDVWKKLSKIDLLFRLTYMEILELKDLYGRKRINPRRKPQINKKVKDK